jgi:hypothetical protein
MTQPQAYRVTWPIIQVRYAQPVSAGDQQLGGITVLRGQILPPNVDPTQLAHLVRLGMVELIATPAGVGADTP